MSYLQIIIVILFFFIYTTETRLFASTDVIVHMNSDIYETAFFYRNQPSVHMEPVNLFIHPRSIRGKNIWFQKYPDPCRPA